LSDFNLQIHGIRVAHVLRNAAPAKLYKEAVFNDPRTAIASSGALIAYSGDKTGRSPKDRRIIRHAESENDVWWGSVNIPLPHRSFLINRQRAVDFLNTRDRLFVIDGYAGWAPRHRVKVRVICARPYHALFMWNMLIRPTREGLAGFGDPDFVIFNAGGFPANPHTEGLTSAVSVCLNLEERQLVILGTEYAGEMKKGVFSYMNYLMPKTGVLSMHCSATADPQTDESAVLFGLSGTGKTTLSADPRRLLIGDDEHCWSEEGIFNIEGGCYAKTINLTREAEPDIFDAIRFGSVLENVVYDPETHVVDYASRNITENTRGAYPIDFIRHAKSPCTAGHPRHVIFLTCDAFGVLPPVSRLTPAQAEYHFISGYTAKVAGTEMGVTEPQATFSACFGGPFLVWHPGKYAEMLADKIRRHNAHVWLLNTGWSGGGYGVGSRIRLAWTRAMVDAIYSGALVEAPTEIDPVFGLHVVTACPGVPVEMLQPKKTWLDKAAYDLAARKLAGLFAENFKTYADGVSAEVRAAGPTF
jgi:phosphoenolpyruvate carboxykinase (ATP)